MKWRAIREQGKFWAVVDDSGMVVVDGLDEPTARLIGAAPAMREGLFNFLFDETDSYCEFCMRHAQKDEAGRIIDAINHKAECPRLYAEKTLKQAEAME